MGQEPATLSESANTIGECCHYWIINSEGGPTSRGTCKLCLAQRDFNNYIGDCLMSDNEGCLERLSWQSRIPVGQSADIEIE